jgi:ribonucleoside-diphosphate reductase alpha chain
VTHKFAVAGHEGYLIVGLYPNGQPGEIFIRMAKEGSTMAGIMESFGLVVSIGLQHGVPLKVVCGKLAHTRFEPSGWTGNEAIGYAKSIMDYIARWLELRFPSKTQLDLFNAKLAVEPVGKEQPGGPVLGLGLLYSFGDAPPCGYCGSLMVRNGTCFKCTECGGTSGCS